MTRTKPNCPSCKHNNDVRTLGGGSLSKYRYECACGEIWQQTPPHREKIDEEDDIVISTKNQRRSSSYKCGKCKQPKKNGCI